MIVQVIVVLNRTVVDMSDCAVVIFRVRVNGIKLWSLT